MKTNHGWILATLLGLLAACSDGGNTSQKETGNSANKSESTSEKGATMTPTKTEGGTAENPPKTDTPAAADPAVPAALKSIRDFIAEQKVDKAKPSWKQSLKKPPMATFAAEDDYFWTLETNQGSMRFRLFTDAPMHATSTIYLTELGFYDDIVFHRVIPGFMAQGGDPTGTGSGGPGYSYDGEFQNKRRHDKVGILSMANTGRPTTDGSQFFIIFKPLDPRHLDGKHTVFGELLEGEPVLRKLEAAGTQGGATTTKLQIIKASISTAKVK